MVYNSHNDTVRETYLQNLKLMYIQNKTIPISIVCDPLITTYTYKVMLQVFDLDFIIYIANHPKLNESTGILMIEMLSKR